MAQRRHHYDQAFETYLRIKRIPYVAVDEAKKALLPESERLSIESRGTSEDQPAAHAIKSFDFVIYTDAVNLLIDVKGRRVGRSPTSNTRGAGFPTVRSGKGRLESWVTQDDIDSLRRWEQLFGPGFRAAFIFLYWCDAQPPDALFQEVFLHRGRWYAVRAVTLDDYGTAMRVRSPRWRTLDLPPADFERLSQPFCGVGTF